jgi:hypothetical protein
MASLSSTRPNRAGRSSNRPSYKHATPNGVRAQTGIFCETPPTLLSVEFQFQPTTQTTKQFTRLRRKVEWYHSRSVRKRGLCPIRFSLSVVVGKLPTPMLVECYASQRQAKAYRHRKRLKSLEVRLGRLKFKYHPGVFDFRLLIADWSVIRERIGNWNLPIGQITPTS